MVISNQYYSKWLLVPKPVRSFILRALTLLIVWKTMYLIFLLPARVLDGPLSYSVGKATTGTLNFLSRTDAFTVYDETKRHEIEGLTSYDPVMAVYFNSKKTLSIADACNGLELFVLYAGFILCLPATKRRKISFIIGGIAAIWIINVLRCVALIYIYLHNAKYTDFSHHYLFKFLVYGFIFCLWLLFSKKLTYAKQT